MKQNLFKFWLTMLCLIVGVGSMWAEDVVVTYDFTKAANFPSGFPTSSGTKQETETEYSFGGNSIYFKTAYEGSIYQASTGSGTSKIYSVFLGKSVKYNATTANTIASTAYMKIPGKLGYKMKSVVAQNASNAATSSVYLSVCNDKYELVADKVASTTSGNRQMTITMYTAAGKTTLASGEAGYLCIAPDVTAGKNLNIEKIIVTYTSDNGSTPTKYIVTVSNSISNGRVIVSPTSAAAGTEITLTPEPEIGYQFDSWNVTNAVTGDAIAVTNNKFTMPAADVNVSAIFNEIKGGSSAGSTFTYNKVTSQSDIVEGATYLIVCENQNTAMGSQNTNRRNNASVKITNDVIVLEKVNEEGMPYEVTLGKQDDKFTMVTSGGKYLGNGSTSNNLKEVQSYAAGYGWTLTYNNGVVTMKTNHSSARYLCVNTQNADSYATYTSDSDYKKVTLYKKQTAPAGPAEIPNLIKTSSADLYVGDEIDNLKTYLNLPNDYEGTVTFSSEQDGTLVTLVDEMLSAEAAGTATIYVTAGAEDGKYLETTGTITLNISKKTPVIAWEESKTSYTIFNLEDNNKNKFVGQTATATEGATVKYTITGTGATIDEDGIVTITGVGEATITASTDATDALNAATSVSYTLNIVNPEVSMTPASGTVSAENPTVTFTGNGVKIAYMDEDSNVEENAGTTISVDADKTETYTVSITDDAANTFDQDFNVYFLQDAGLQFSANELRVVVGTTEVEEPVLSKTTDATVTYELIYGDPEKGANVATIDPTTGKLTLTGKSTETQGSVTVKATTPATAKYTAGEATYELVVYRNVPSFTWSAASVTIDQDELDQLPTPVCDRNVTTLESSNTEVARIENKQVVFVGYGTTTITGKTTATADYAQATASYELTFAPRYTVTFNVNGNETELREETTGAGVTAPEVAAIADYTFAGWASAAVAEETTDAQTFVALTDGKYMPTENTPLFAVYKRVEGAPAGQFEKLTNLSNLENGTKVVVVNNASNLVLGTKLSGAEETTTIADAATINVTDDAFVWTYEGSITSFTLTNNSTEKTLGSGSIPGSGKSTYVSGSISNKDWKIAASSASGVSNCWTLSNASGVGLETYNSKWYIYNTSFASYAACANRVYVESPSTTYYTSTPVLEVATISVSQYKNTTLCLSRAYTMPSGLVGKTISVKEGSAGEYTLTLTPKYEAGAVVPAGEALVVQGAQGTYNAIAAASSEAKTAYPDNLLVAEYTKSDAKFLTSYDSENSDDYYYYKLTTKNGENFGWYYGEEGGAPFLMSSKERAYLVIAKDVAAGIRGFVLSDMENNLVTDIHSMETIAPQETIYNLQGQRMNRLQKGINIMGGKKVIR